MSSMPKTVEFLGKKHKFKYEGCARDNSGTYSFVHEGVKVEILWYGDEEEFDTVTGEAYCKEGFNGFEYNTRDKARTLKATLKLIERRVEAYLNGASRSDLLKMGCL